MLRFIFHPPDTKEGPGKEEDVGAYEVNGKEGEEEDEASSRLEIVAVGLAGDGGDG